jgi:L-glutamine-phosphate cytidylyltransferase
MNKNSIKTAVILAAGMGNRLRPITDSIPKCMVEIGGKPLLAHTLDALEANGFIRVIIVTGYKKCQIEEFLNHYPTSLEVDTIHNDLFDVTNNIYSLWLASKEIEEGFTLIESDILLEPAILGEFTKPDKIALDLFSKEKHHGTTATVDTDLILEKLYINQSAPVYRTVYKTVNIYSFSPNTWHLIRDEISRIVDRNEVNGFYEVAIQNLIEKKSISLELVDFSTIWWDEIDTIEDLGRVNNSLKKQNHFVPIRELEPDFSI